MPEMIEVAERIRSIRKRDSRYRPEAYEFVLQALDHTYRRIGERRHVSGREFLEGLREFALERFGHMALLVFEHWGVRTTDDVGAIVFNLVEARVMGKTAADTLDDFHAVYDFHEAFAPNEPLKVEWADEG